MAWLEQRGQQYHLCFRCGGQKFKKSLRTNQEHEAQTLLKRVERRLQLVEQGDLTIPDDADLLTFLLSDGKRTQPLKPAPAKLTLAEVCRRYEESLPAGSIEANTRYTLRIHQKHLQRLLGATFPFLDLSFSDLQSYVEKRGSESGRRGQPLSPVTIKKELASLSGMWSWALCMKMVKASFPNRGLRFAKTTEKPPYQTWAEIERRIAVGGLSEVEQATLWDGLYLTIAEVGAALDFVEETDQNNAIYPMLVFAAHTGARRSEILRSETADFDFTAGTVLIHEKKRARGKQTTRSVPLSGRLSSVMKEWIERNPNRWTFLRDGERLTVDEASWGFISIFAGSRWEKLKGWHVFRHSFISNCASRGVDQRMIDAWSGHQTEEMRKRYRHLFPDVQQAALQTVFG